MHCFAKVDSREIFHVQNEKKDKDEKGVTPERPVSCSALAGWPGCSGNYWQMVAGNPYPGGHNYISHYSFHLKN